MLRSGLRIWYWLFLVAVLCGCSTSTNIEGQALDDKDRSLSGIKNTLVFFTANMEAAERGRYFRVQDFFATNLDTQERYSFPQFANMFLGSSSSPHEIDGNELIQTVFWDLPAGRYEIDKLALVTLQDFLDASTDDWIYHHPFPRPVFEISGTQPLFLGQLNIKVKAIKKQGDHFQADLLIFNRAADKKSLDQLESSFPALQGAESRMGYWRFSN